MRVCAQPGCPALTDQPRCPTHTRTHDQARGTRHQRGLGGTWPTLSRLTLQRDDYVCWICGKPNANTADHIVPRSKGGTNDLDNLRAAHRSCNSRRGTGPT